jgi:hypothetical protein
MNRIGRLHKFLSPDIASRLLAVRRSAAEAEEPLAQATATAVLPRTLHADEPAPVPGEVTVLARGRTAAAVVEELMGALAGEPFVVDCDLTGMAAEGSATGEEFAPIGHYLRHWPATTLLIRVLDPGVRSSLTAMASMTHADRMIIHTGCDDAALQAHRLLPQVQRQTLSLPPTLTAPRAARDFAADTLRGWRLPGATVAASQVLNEFVTHGVISGGTDMTVSLSRMDNRIRIATAHPANTSTAVGELSEHPLTALARQLVQAQAQNWGVIGGRLAGTTMWAVLDASPALDGDQGKATGHRAKPRHRGSAGPDALAELQVRPGGRHRRENGMPKTKAST